MRYGFYMGTDQRSLIRTFKSNLKGVRYEGIAFSGNSGCLIGSLLARATNKAMVLVRKTTKDCHSDNLVEGHTTIKSYIIVDDTVSSGHTERRIIRRMKKFCPKAKYVGTYEVCTYNFVKADYEEKGTL
jgi:adenine/guanine phosphoribosyltransferase-like PRPP-binding protein